MENFMQPYHKPRRRRRRHQHQPEIVGLFGLPTQEGMEKVMVKKMGTSVEDLKEHVTKQLRIPMILVSAASVALILYLFAKKK